MILCWWRKAPSFQPSIMVDVMAGTRRTVRNDPLIRTINAQITADPSSWEDASWCLLESAKLLGSHVSAALSRQEEIRNDPTWSGFVGGHPLEPEWLECLNGSRITGVVQMLYAMSIECRLKVAIVHLGKQVPKGKGGHDLRSLAREAGIVADQDTDAVLAEMTYMIQLGRYPTHRDDNVPPGAGWPPDHAVLDKFNLELDRIMGFPVGGSP